MKVGKNRGQAPFFPKLIKVGGKNRNTVTNNLLI